MVENPGVHGPTGDRRLGGEIDASMASCLPCVSCVPPVFRRDGGGVRGVVPGYAGREVECHERTGNFPIT